MGIIKNTLVWLWSHKNISLYIILILIIAFLTWRNNNLASSNEKLIIEQGNLPDNIEFVAEMKGTKFKVTYRDSKNNIIFKEYYVPKEGGVKFTKYIDLKKYDANSGFNGVSVNAPTAPRITNPISSLISGIFGPKNEKKGEVIDVEWFGFTCKFGIAGVYSGGRGKQPLEVAVDTKLFYMNRYSLGLGSSVEFPYIWLSRHIDDLVPFIQIDNLEVMCGYGKPYSNFENSVFVVGGRTNF